jgi:hypothetical protein
MAFTMFVDVIYSNRRTRCDVIFLNISKLNTSFHSITKAKKSLTGNHLGARDFGLNGQGARDFGPGL